MIGIDNKGADFSGSEYIMIFVPDGLFYFHLQSCKEDCKTFCNRFYETKMSYTYQDPGLSHDHDYLI